MYFVQLKKEIGLEQAMVITEGLLLEEYWEELSTDELISICSVSAHGSELEKKAFLMIKQKIEASLQNLLYIYEKNYNTKNSKKVIENSCIEIVTNDLIELDFDKWKSICDRSPSNSELGIIALAKLKSLAKSFEEKFSYYQRTQDNNKLEKEAMQDLIELAIDPDQWLQVYIISEEKEVCELALRNMEEKEADCALWREALENSIPFYLSDTKKSFALQIMFLVVQTGNSFDEAAIEYGYLADSGDQEIIKKLIKKLTGLVRNYNNSYSLYLLASSNLNESEDIKEEALRLLESRSISLDKLVKSHQIVRDRGDEKYFFNKILEYNTTSARWIEIYEENSFSVEEKRDLIQQISMGFKRSSFRNLMNEFSSQFDNKMTSDNSPRDAFISVLYDKLSNKEEYLDFLEFVSYNPSSEKVIEMKKDIIRKVYSELNFEELLCVFGNIPHKYPEKSVVARRLKEFLSERFKGEKMQIRSKY